MRCGRISSAAPGCWLALLLLLAGCASPAAPQALPERSFRLAPGQAVVVEANAGVIDIAGGEGEELRLSGQLAYADRTQLSVAETPEAITITAQYQGSPSSDAAQASIRLTLQVPNATPLRLDTFKATVNLRNYSGQASIASVGGDIVGQNLTGTLSLRSGRGDIALLGGSGEFHVLGEHGVLSLQGLSGQVEASTIMGTIRYAGAPQAGDALHFETDHGPVEIELGAEADLALTVATTSGVVDCVIPGLQPVLRGCAGSLGKGRGSLAVRTVSGTVSVRRAP